MNYSNILAKELQWNEQRVAKIIELLDEGNTIPFIARYRKEMTGEMDEVVLCTLDERLNYLRNLEKRKEEVLHSISEQEKLTPELEQKIRAATILQEVEDLYLPYKAKHKTRASVAKEKGLEPLAWAIFSADNQIEPLILAADYLNPELGVNLPEEALQGAKDILAEMISDDAEIRKLVRALGQKEAIIQAKAVEGDAVSVYQNYYEYSEPLKKAAPHRILALNRGEKEKFLKVKVVQTEEEIIKVMEKKYLPGFSNLGLELAQRVIEDSFKRLISPAIERELRNELTEKAENQAIKVFADNLHNLLLQSPVRNRRVLGFDPSYRTGCKLAMVDETGKVLGVEVIYPHAPQNKWQEAKKKLVELINKYKLSIVAIGNGTASRESELLIAEILRENELDLEYIIVSEAGASVYSASPLAKEEFPEYDLSLRSAVSIARRLQDPLAELVKIDPKSIGVGQYQHDINSKRLDESLSGVVESCVNSVGVELNTASASLLQYVAGLTKATAKSIVKRREEKGIFKNRKELLEVPRLGEKAFVQCAGFIRIAEGENPLDNTSVHPESYPQVSELLRILGYLPEDLTLKERLESLRVELGNCKIKELAGQLELGEPTLRDIVSALQKPGRDPREELPPPLFRSDVLKMEDLAPGMELKGTVRNVVDFGAFVDIGVKQDGLVHISQLGEKYVKHPSEAVGLGDIVKVKVLEVDVNRGRISLTMRGLKDEL